MPKVILDEIVRSLSHQPSSFAVTAVFAGSNSLFPLGFELGTAALNTLAGGTAGSGICLLVARFYKKKWDVLTGLNGFMAGQVNVPLLRCLHSSKSLLQLRMAQMAI